MKILLIISMIVFGNTFTSSIYTKHFTSLTGNEIYLSQYQGKKMLLVNMASESEYAATQIPQLEQLYQQFHDSLVVIGFFSNDFGHEPRSNSDLRLLLQDTYHSTFPVSQKIGVKDSTGNTHELYTWLQRQSENGSIDSKVKRDFQKYLVD
ncbi:MAG TPA: hypothetical protein VKH37_13165, partial [Ferruginibacter sp.]|nr:hypothetical protein [Ferruginibacter sp.]